MSLDRLVADVNKSKTTPTVKVQNDPPTIFVSYTPAILLQVDGEPTRADIADTDLGFIVNSNFPLFFETDATKDYYLYTGAQWLKSASIEGPWTPAPKLPGDFSKVANNPKWADMKKPILSPSAKGKPPTIFYSNKPAEVICSKASLLTPRFPGQSYRTRPTLTADLFIYAATQTVLLPCGWPLVQEQPNSGSVDLCDAGSTGLISPRFQRKVRRLACWSPFLERKRRRMLCFWRRFRRLPWSAQRPQSR